MQPPMSQRPPSILQLLSGGDRRSIGHSELVVKRILANRRVVRDVVAALFDRSPIVRMRAADALEKVTRSQPQLLTPYKRELLAAAQHIKQQEVRWHIGPMLGRLSLTPWERQRVAKILAAWLRTDSSALVRVFALQALADLSLKDFHIRKQTLQRLRLEKDSESPAVRSRAARLLAELLKKPKKR